MCMADKIASKVISFVSLVVAVGLVRNFYGQLQKILTLILYT